MPGALRYNRKAIIYILLILSVFCYFVFYDNSASAQSFRTSTEAGLARARGQKTHHDTKTPLQENLSDEDQTKKANEKLQSILESTKNRENAKSSGEELKEKISDKLGNLPGTEKLQHDVEDISVAGRKKMPNPNSPKATDEKESIMKTDAKTDVKTKDKAEEKDTTEEVDPAKDFAREKLMEYLKNPVVIFSKSTCPHSKRAKHLLLEIYSITPKPLVVELDRLNDPVPSSNLMLGRVMQDVLGGMTGRRTVPNIMVGGVHSIGGNDKIWELHEKGLLAEEIRKLGGRKVTEVDVVAEA